MDSPLIADLSKEELTSGIQRKLEELMVLSNIEHDIHILQIFKSSPDMKLMKIRDEVRQIMCMFADLMKKV